MTPPAPKFVHIGLMNPGTRTSSTSPRPTCRSSGRWSIRRRRRSVGVFRSHPELVDEALGSPGRGSSSCSAGRSTASCWCTLRRSSSSRWPYTARVDELGRHLVRRGAGHAPLRVPVFDAGQLREFGVDPARRYFMVEHLALVHEGDERSGMDPTPGSLAAAAVQRAGRGPPAATLDAVPESDRPGIYRRLGDLALFLTGVFPDHSTARPVHPIELERLLRSLPVVAGSRPTLATSSGPAGDGRGGSLLEWLGPRWYRAAAERTPVAGLGRLLGDMASSLRPGAPVPQSPHRPVPVPGSQPMVPGGRRLASESEPTVAVTAA